MKKTALTFAITVFCFVTFYSLRQISQLYLQPASAEDQIAALDFFYNQQEEIILKNAQNDLDMLRNSDKYTFLAHFKDLYIGETNPRSYARYRSRNLPRLSVSHTPPSKKRKRETSLPPSLKLLYQCFTPKTQVLTKFSNYFLKKMI
jgi:hypothetical protein